MHRWRDGIPVRSGESGGRGRRGFRVNKRDAGVRGGAGAVSREVPSRALGGGAEGGERRAVRHGSCSASAGTGVRGKTRRTTSPRDPYVMPCPSLQPAAALEQCVLCPLLLNSVPGNVLVH